VPVEKLTPRALLAHHRQSRRAPGRRAQPAGFDLDGCWFVGSQERTTRSHPWRPSVAAGPGPPPDFVGWSGLPRRRRGPAKSPDVVVCVGPAPAKPLQDSPLGGIRLCHTSSSPAPTWGAPARPSRPARPRC
jgi:hypothetical protein